MDTVPDFHWKHTGETILVIANGDGLLNIPISFLRKFPSIGMNHIAWYSDVLEGFMPNYWVALDDVPLENIPKLNGVTKFIPHYFEEQVQGVEG